MTIKREISRVFEERIVFPSSSTKVRNYCVKQLPKLPEDIKFLNRFGHEKSSLILDPSIENFESEERQRYLAAIATTLALQMQASSLTIGAAINSVLGWVSRCTNMHKLNLYAAVVTYLNNNWYYGNQPQLIPKEREIII